MTRKRWAVVALVAFVGGAGVWMHGSGGLLNGTVSVAAEKDLYFCPMHPTYTSDRPGICPICSMKLVKRSHEEKAQSDSTIVPRELTVKEIMAMKPGEICLLHKCKMGACTVAMTEEFARLGKCPMCGDDLGVIVKDMTPEGYAQVKIGAEKQKLIGVKTAVAQKQHVTRTIRSAGQIAHDPDLYQAQEEHIQNVKAVERAQASGNAELKEHASKLLDSSRLKLKHLGLNDAMVMQIESSEKPDQGLLYGDAGGKVWLYAPIYEYEMPLVKVGDMVEVELPAILDKKFSGAIRSIDPVLDPMTRSVRVRAQLENPDGMLKPEMYVNAMIRIDLGEMLAVPQEAIFATGEKNIIFVAKPDGNFEPREVVVGTKTGELAEIKSGIAPGESVVTSGNFLIDSESRLKGALEGIAGAGHQHGK